MLIDSNMNSPKETNTFYRNKVDISNTSTTYLDDYRKNDELYKDMPKFTRSKVEKPGRDPPPAVFLDWETFIPLRKRIPIGLLAVTNEITKKDPHIPIKHTELPEDTMKEQVIKSRPRMKIPPQVSIDDIPDPEMKKMILDYTYTTDFRKTEHELLSMVGIEYRIVPDTVLEHDKFLTTSKKHYFTVFMKPKALLQIEMTPEQNIEGRAWGNQQLTGITSQTEHFWKNKEVKCGACFDPTLNLVEAKTKAQISELVQKDRIRIGHDKISPTYAGFKPVIPIGIGLPKQDHPTTHPLLSTYETVFNTRIRDIRNP